MLKFGRAGRLVWLGRLPLESKPKAALTRLRSPVQLRPGPLNFLFFKKRTFTKRKRRVWGLI